MKYKRNVNSRLNQKIKEKFVDREVICNFSCEMDRLLKEGAKGNRDFPSFEDIENLYLDPKKHYKKYGYNSAEEYEESGENFQEIYEWWIISGWLYEKLLEKDEPVLEWENHYYWGRTGTGQAILLDGVISDICIDMEILEGQKNEWKL